jgi:hypothetical protein
MSVTGTPTCSGSLIEAEDFECGKPLKYHVSHDWFYVDALESDVVLSSGQTGCEMICSHFKIFKNDNLQVCHETL